MVCWTQTASVMFCSSDIVYRIDYSVRHKLYRYGTVQYSKVKYSPVRYSTVRYGIVRYGTV